MKTFDNLDRDDYWMGMAFVMAAGKNATLIVATSHNSNPYGKLISSARETVLQNSKNILLSEILAITSCPVDITSSTVYMTGSLSYESYMTMVAAGVKRIVCSKSLGENLKNASKLEYVSLEEFAGNLNWMRDYITTIA